MTRDGIARMMLLRMALQKSFVFSGDYHAAREQSAKLIEKATRFDISLYIITLQSNVGYYVDAGDIESAQKTNSQIITLLNEHQGEFDKEDFDNVKAMTLLCSAVICCRLLKFQEALQPLLDGLSLLTTQTLSYPDDHDLKKIRGFFHQLLSEAYIQLGDTGNAGLYSKLNMALYDDLYILFPTDPEIIYRVIKAHINMGDFYAMSDELRSCLIHFQKANLMASEALANENKSIEIQLVNAISFQKLGYTFFSLNDLPNAVESYEEYFRLSSELRYSLPDALLMEINFAPALLTLGRIYISLNRDDDALIMLNNALNLANELLERIPKFVQLRRVQSIAYSLLATIYQQANQFEKCEYHFSKAIPLFMELEKEATEGYLAKSDLAVVCSQFATFLADQANNEKAIFYYQEALHLWAELSVKYPLVEEYAQYAGSIAERLNELS
ncbi:MAG: hypothetical protein NTW29_04915 [Bacteroidetes bacterium]|nr:hypothetical protein [Bacteroidota bacterium]